MQKRIQILILLIGLIASAHITPSKINSNQEFISSFLQKNELRGNTAEGQEGVKVLEKMIKDLENKETLLHQQAKQEFDTCKKELEKLNCKDQDRWYDNIKNQNDNIKQLEKQNDDLDDKISSLQDQKDKINKDHEIAKEEAKQKVLANYRNIIKMIQKIIKVMVDTYNVTTTEDLSGIQSFSQKQQLIELQQDITVLSSVANQDHFAQMANVYMQQAIIALIEKRYDTESAKKFISLMEKLIEKLRKGRENVKNNFQYDNSQQQSNLDKLDEQINDAKKQKSRNDIKIDVGNKANNKDYDKISKCQKAAGQMNKCEEDYNQAKALADSDDDLIRILKQVLKDTKALLGIIDEDWDNSFKSKMIDGDAGAWINEQIKKYVGNRKATLCYRASENSCSAPKFHQKCNGKGASITIIKTTKDQIIGGYNPVSWKSNSNYNKQSAGGFIFSYNKRHVGKQNRYPQYSTYNHNSYGPTFGGGHDLYIANNCNSGKSSYANMGHTYQCPLGTNGGKCSTYYSAESNYHFGVKDYEVYILK